MARAVLVAAVAAALVVGNGSATTARRDDESFSSGGLIELMGQVMGGESSRGPGAQQGLLRLAVQRPKARSSAPAPTFLPMAVPAERPPPGR